MSDILTLLLLFAGAFFLLLAGIGVLRLPDVFSRMQAATKAATFGAGLMLLAVAAYFSDFGVTVRALLVVAFFFLTAPVAAHMIGRAAYITGVPLWEGTFTDELRGRYHPRTHTLDSEYSAGAPAFDETIPDAVVGEGGNRDGRDGGRGG